MAGLTANKKISVAGIIVFFLCCQVFVFAQEGNQPKIPEGMEAVSIGGSAQLIIPKGAKTRKVGAQIIVEGTKEYMSRRFEEMEERFARFEAAQEELKKEVQSLQEQLNGTDIKKEEKPTAETIK